MICNHKNDCETVKKDNCLINLGGANDKKGRTDIVFWHTACAFLFRGCISAYSLSTVLLYFLRWSWMTHFDHHWCCDSICSTCLYYGKRRIVSWSWKNNFSALITYKKFASNCHFLSILVCNLCICWLFKGGTASYGCRKLLRRKYSFVVFIYDRWIVFDHSFTQKSYGIQMVNKILFDCMVCAFCCSDKFKTLAFVF